MFNFLKKRRGCDTELSPLKWTYRTSGERENKSIHVEFNLRECSKRRSKELGLFDAHKKEERK